MSRFSAARRRVAAMYSSAVEEGPPGNRRGLQGGRRDHLARLHVPESQEGHYGGDADEDAGNHGQGLIRPRAIAMRAPQSGTRQERI